MSDSDSTTTRGLSVQQLLCAVENELIPRLLCAHASEVSEGNSPARLATPLAGPWADEPEVSRFATLCIDDDGEAASRHISGLVGQGIGLDAVYLYLLAPAARELGKRWGDDDLSFVDVQFGLTFLHNLVCDCGPIGFHHAVALPHSVLLSSVPGDQHTFAIAMVTDFFRRFGWQASNLCGLSADFLFERIASRHYDVLGLSANNTDSLIELERLLPRLRKASFNPRLVVIIGGDIVHEQRRRIEALGVDLVAADAHVAVHEAERLVALARACEADADRIVEGRFAMVE